MVTACNIDPSMRWAIALVTRPASFNSLAVPYSTQKAKPSSLFILSHREAYQYRYPIGLGQWRHHCNLSPNQNL
jgi:hypothetical protein